MRGYIFLGKAQPLGFALPLCLSVNGFKAARLRVFFVSQGASFFHNHDFSRRAWKPPVAAQMLLAAFILVVLVLRQLPEKPQ